MSEIPATSILTKKLEGKVVIVTGGASGIGEVTVHLFAEHGARGIVIADIQDEMGQKVAASIGSSRCSYIHCDVSDEEQVKSMVGSTLEIYGQLDIMFSNAGIMNAPDKTILDLDFSKFDRLFAINVRGMAACVKYAARAMVEKGVKGSILCMASIAASTGAPKFTDYSMSKHGVIGLVRSASKELGEHGIRVNSVSPFIVATPLMCGSHQMDVSGVEEFYRPFTSLKGTVLKASDIANAVLFLVSDDSAFITGHDLVVDGGYKT